MKGAPHPADGEPAGSGAGATFVDGEWILYGDFVDQDTLDFLAITADPVGEDPDSWTNLPPERRRATARFGLGLLAALLVVGFVVAPRVIEQPVQLDDHADSSTIEVHTGDLVSITLPDATWDFEPFDAADGLRLETDAVSPRLCNLDPRATGCTTKRVRVLTPGLKQLVAWCRDSCVRATGARTWSVALFVS